MAIGINPVQGAASQALNAPTIGATPIPAQGVTDTEAQPVNLPNTWLKQDLENPYIIPWGEFDVNPNINFRNILSGAYHVEPPKPAWMSYLNSSMLGGRGTNMYQQWTNTGAKDLYGRELPQMQHQQIFSLPYLPNSRGLEKANAQLDENFRRNTGFINFKDKNLDAAIDALNAASSATLRPQYKPTPAWQSGFSSFLGPNYKSPQQLKAEKEAAAKIIANSEGWSPLSRLADAKMREQLLSQTASKFGITMEDLQAAYGKYDKAFRSLHDPVGANWQDLKQSPVYDQLIAGIRDYAQANSKGGAKGRSTGFTDAWFDNANKLAGDVNTNPYMLPAEYFVLHQPNRIYPGRGGADGTGAVKGKGYSALANHDPYRMQDWSDYADANKAIWQYTPEEIAAAKKAMGEHSALLKAPYEKGGPFSLVKEGNLRLPRLKGVKEYWQYSPKMGQIDVMQNALGWNTQGKKSIQDVYSDAGINAAYKDSIYLKKKKKKKGGLGGILGTALSLASFAVPALKIPAMAFNAVNAIKSGNPLGALMSIASGTGVLDKIGAATGLSKLTEGVPAVVKAGGLGAISSALSGGNPLIGAALGAGGQGLGQSLVDNGWSVPAAQIAAGVGKGVLGNMYAYNQAKDRAKKAAVKATRRA